MIPTPQQQRAITMKGNTLAVIAGPGSGKTETLAERILEDQRAGVDPSKQIAITFTNNAGDELRARLLRKGAKRPRHTGTLHSWAFRSLRELRAPRPNYREMEVINDKKYEEIIKEVLRVLGHKSSVAAARELAMTSGGTAGNKMVLSLAIRRTMIRKGKIHADLMLALFAQELERDDPATDGLAIYVDEFQDTAAIDALIYRLLRKRHGASFYAVGDWRQAIYGFRGATPVHFLELIKEADDTAELTANFRSCPLICEAATRLAKGMPSFGNSPIEIQAASRYEGMLSVQDFATAEEEALEMVDWVKGHRGEPGRSIAILTRYNQGVGLIAGVLRAHGIEVQASTDVLEFEEQSRTLPVDLILHMDDRTEEGWKQALAAMGAPLAVQDTLAARLATASSPEARVAILSAGEQEVDRDKIWVSTIHAAKGLEWDAVWLAGLDNLAFRGKEATDHCLAFVGVTRARSWLKMTYARSRQAHRRETGLKPTELNLWPMVTA